MVMDALAVWIGPYVAAAAWVFDHIAGTQEASAQRLLALALLVWSVYLLHRWRRLRAAKRFGSGDSRRDWLAQHPRALAWISLAVTVAAVAALANVSWQAIALAPMGFAAAWLYAGPRLVRRRRVRETLLLKDVAVGAALAVVCAACLLLQPTLYTTSQTVVYWAARWSFWLGFMFVALIACADAIVCDIEDAAFDAKEGAQTPVVVWGRRKASVVSICLAVLAGLVPVGAALLGSQPMRQALWWAVVIPASSAGVALLNAHRPRRLIELRLVILVAVAALF